MLYYWVFAGCITAVFVSTMKRREKHGLGGGDPGLLRGLNIFLAAAFMFSFVALGDAALGAAFRDRPLAFALAQVLGAAGAGLFALVMEVRYREEARRHRQELLKETAALWKELEKDPLNAAWLERLAELYKKTGDLKAAVACAEKAFALDPSRLNEWKVEALKEAPPRPGRSPGLLEAALGVLTCRIEPDLLKKRKDTDSGSKR